MKALAAGWMHDPNTQPYHYLEGDLEIQLSLHDTTDDIAIWVGNPDGWLDVELNHTNAVYLHAALGRLIDEISQRRTP